MANESLRSTNNARSYGSTMEGEIGFAPPEVFDTPTFQRLCDKVTSNIYQIQKHATTLDKTLKTIGTRNDTDTLRDSVHTVASTATSTIGDTTKILKQLSAMTLTRAAADHKEAKLKFTRLTSDFKLVVEKFTGTQKQIVTKMKSTAPVRTEFVESDDQKQALVDAEAAQQAQLQYQQHLEFEQDLLRERESRVRQIEADIVDVNDIMRDLATMVVDQRATVDSIEGNIDATYTQVETGRAELQKAETYQSKYRKRLFCLLATGVIILVIVIVILVTQLKS